MQEHTSIIYRTAFLELRRIASNRSHLSKSVCASLVALTTSRLDATLSSHVYRQNSFIGYTERVQNNAARLAMKKRKREHVTALVKELHWLPVKFRCEYKIAVLAYHHFEGSLPPYLSASLCRYQTSRTLRSSNEKLLIS